MRDRIIPPQQVVAATVLAHGDSEGRYQSHVDYWRTRRSRFQVQDASERSQFAHPASGVSPCLPRIKNRFHRNLAGLFERFIERCG